METLGNEKIEDMKTTITGIRVMAIDDYEKVWQRWRTECKHQKALGLA